MKAKITLLWLCLFFLVSQPGIAANPYSGNATRAVQWLTQYQYGDGSFGPTYDVLIPCTTEVVLAMQAVNQRTTAYYKGIAWLESHSGPNVDYVARRIMALGSHGDDVSVDLTYIQNIQALTSPGNSGWGLTQDYQGSPIDSALALLAYFQKGITSNTSQAISYLTGSQLSGTDKGWSVAQETISDPFTTSLVVQALVNYNTSNSLSTPIANGVSALTAKVGAGSQTHLKALAALACIRAGYNPTTLLNSLTATQASDGSWSEDIYATALAARALAAAAGTDIASLSTIVNIPDPNLRAAINKALGRNAMDALTRGDMANLVSISAENMGITDLTGMEWAVNLTSADFKNNNITSIAPLSGLPQLKIVDWTGNPGYTPPPSTAVPAMSIPGLLLTAVLLMLVSAVRLRGVCRHED